MNRTGWVVAAVACTVGSGLGIGALAHVARQDGAPVSAEGPGALAWAPSDATIIGQVDIRSLAESPLSDSWMSAVAAGDGLEAMDELEERTGIHPGRDVSRATFFLVDSAEPKKRPPERWGIVLDGNFDRDGILQRMSEHHALASDDYEGIPIHGMTDRDEARSFAVAFPDAGNLLLLGQPEFVRSMIAAGLGRAASGASGALMEKWNDGELGNATFWIVGSPAEGMSQLIGGPAGAGAGKLPPLQSFALTGRLNQALTLTARGLASDATSAQQLADVARGFIALGRLNEDASPELKGLMDSITIGQIDDRLEVSVTVPRETMERFIESRSSNPQ